MSLQKKNLMELAQKARETSYAPYSGYQVGAALPCKDGSIHTGGNIENAAFSPTVCAERVALFKAINEGKRNFSAIAVAGGKGKDCDEYCTPCGVCRQVMQEFCDPDTFLVLVCQGKEVRSYLLRELLPLGFRQNNLEGKNK